jgi:hypothetical protein
MMSRGLMSCSSRPSSALQQQQRRQVASDRQTSVRHVAAATGPAAPCSSSSGGRWHQTGRRASGMWLLQQGQQRHAAVAAAWWHQTDRRASRPRDSRPLLTQRGKRHKHMWALLCNGRQHSFGNQMLTATCGKQNAVGGRGQVGLRILCAAAKQGPKVLFCMTNRTNYIIWMVAKQGPNVPFCTTKWNKCIQLVAVTDVRHEHSNPKQNLQSMSFASCSGCQKPPEPSGAMPWAKSAASGPPTLNPKP